MPEDQQKFVVPLTRNTENLFYNQRIIVDNNILTEPRTWQISKINRINQNGTVLITLAQDKFDQHKDYIEKDVNGNVVGMWADYYIQPIQEDTPTSNIRCEISFSAKAQLKVGGGYKKFSVTFYDNDEPIPVEDGVWSYTIDGEDASNLLSVVAGDSSNQIKVKFDADDSYIGKQIVITYTGNSGVFGNVIVDIVGL